MLNDVLLITEKNDLENNFCRTDDPLSLAQLDDEQKIDNSRTVYFPIKLRNGIKIMCRPEVLTICPEILECLESDCQCCLNLLPESVQLLVKRTIIWVNASYMYGSAQNPQIVHHTTAHHSKDWLLWARDRPDKALGIEIYNCFDYVRMRDHWNGCGLLLHELCHLIHQQVLGLDNGFIRSLYDRTLKSGKYECVLRRDWAGKNVDWDMAYCTVDHKEFFAEMSVTYWSMGYRNLDTADKLNMEECCPPITCSAVLERFRFPKNEPDNSEMQNGTRKTSIAAGTFYAVVAELRFRKSGLTHCNKFYPFTNGQFRHFDPDLFVEFERIWKAIAEWEDPQNTKRCFGCDFLPWTRNQSNKFHDIFESFDSSTVLSDTVDL